MHPNTDSSIVRFMRDRWMPEMTRIIREKHGWEYYYYGNLQGQGEDRGWYTFDYRPRFNNNYVGLRNRMAILSEAYSYATFQDRILATSRFLEEILAFAHRNAHAIRDITARADAASIAGRTLAVQADYERSGPVEILMGEVAQERNPYTGATMLRRLDVKTPQRMPEFGTYVPTETTRAPRAYLVPAEQIEVIERLIAHGVQTTPLASARQVRVERFRIDSTRVAEREFQGHRERSLFGAYETVTLDIPAGTLVVPVEQPLGRLAFTLLEPRSSDGFLNWNVLDRRLEGATHYPIMRTDEALR
jgi:hypothetical protein